MEDIKNTCRICLLAKPTDELSPIFDNVTDILLGRLTNMNIPKLECLPKSICGGCMNILNISINFRDLCEKSEAHLKEIFYSPPPINNMKFISNDQTNNIDTAYDYDDDEDDDNDNVEENELNNTMIVKNEYEKEESIGLAIPSEPDTNSVIQTFGPVKVISGFEISYYNCPDCNKLFRFEISLKVHSLKHGKKIRCGVCNESFTNIKTFKLHISIHANYKPFSCDDCSKVFTNIKNLTKHALKVHPNDIPRYLCLICGQRYFNANQLINHMKMHEKEPPKPLITKPVVKKPSQPSHYSNIIIKNRSTINGKKYICNVCGKKFTHASSLEAHKNIHIEEKPYFCPSKFNKSSNIQYFTGSQTRDGTYKCDICDKNFVSKEIVNLHYNKYHATEKKSINFIYGKKDEIPPPQQKLHIYKTVDKVYKCEVCSKQYLTANNLAAHRRTHGCVRMYKCNFCEKTFADSFMLMCHKRAHQKEKPYICKFCGNRYSLYGQLMGHKKAHHPECFVTTVV